MDRNHGKKSSVTVSRASNKHKETLARLMKVLDEVSEKEEVVLRPLKLLSNKQQSQKT